jgi:serine/threonine-protein kinase
MGEVFLCTDAHIGREVALKLMHGKNRERSDGPSRFLREASIQGQLEHPAIVPIYDIGSAPNFGVFFTMKRIRGETLREVLHQLRERKPEALQKYSRAKLLSAFQQLCLAVDFAHTRGVVHRDIKPGNIMLGDFGEVYVLDWGIAKLIDGPRTDEGIISTPESPPTAAGAVIGTPGYMAPEQRIGAIETIDGRSDIYSLGVVLREILTLEAPHPESALSLSGLEPELFRAIDRATRERAQDRYRSARELAEVIEKFLDGDRDLELRRELAKTQTAKARAAVDKALRATGAEEQIRGEAMREVAAALALDPDNEDAKRALLELLLNPPKVLPRSAAAERKTIDRSTRAMAARNGAVGIFTFLLFVPMVLWTGVHDRLLAAATLIVLLVLVTVGAFGAYRVPTTGPSEIGRALMFFSAMTFFAMLSRLFGPLVMVPGLVAGVLAPLMINFRGGTALNMFIWGQIAIFGPFILELAGVLPKSYEFINGAMVIKPQLATLSETPVLIGLALLAFGTIAIPTIILRRVRGVLDEAEAQLAMKSWYVRSLAGSAEK